MRAVTKAGNGGSSASAASIAASISSMRVAGSSALASAASMPFNSRTIHSWKLAPSGVIVSVTVAIGIPAPTMPLAPRMAVKLAGAMSREIPEKTACSL